MTTPRPRFTSVYDPDYIGASEGDSDFTVSYASGNLLAVAGVPFSFTEINVSYIKWLPISGTLRTFTLEDTEILTRTDDTIQIDEAEFKEDDHFEVGLKGQKKGYNPTSDAQRVEAVDSIALDSPSYGEVTSSFDFLSGTSGIGWVSGSSFYDCDGYSSLRLYANYGYGIAGTTTPNTLHLRLLGKYDNTSGEKYDFSGTQPIIELVPLDEHGDAAIPTSHTEFYQIVDPIDVRALSEFNIAFSESIGTDGSDDSMSGSLSLYYKLLND